MHGALPFTLIEAWSEPILASLDRTLSTNQQEKEKMSAKQLLKAAGAIAGCAGLILVGALINPSRVIADDERGSGDDDSKIELGLQIAPVHLTFARRNRSLVGLGSYIVNAVSECNGCHSAGDPTAFVPGHNPFFRLGPKPPFFAPPKAVNPATYLGGGNDFGQLQPGPSPHIISRNLTPDKTGLPEEGADFPEFFQSIRLGKDHDHLHPNCSATITTNCFNPPFNGDLLQVMPWPAYQDWTDRDLRAVYEYLRAIPCVAGPGHAC
jgi:hypothetical protein